MKNDIDGLFLYINFLDNQAHLKFHCAPESAWVLTGDMLRVPLISGGFVCIFLRHVKWYSIRYDE